MVPPIGHGQETPKARAQENTGPSTSDVCMVSCMSDQTYIKYAKNVAEPVGRPRASDPPDEPEQIQICKTCFSTWAPSKSHNCTKSGKRENNQKMDQES